MNTYQTTEIAKMIGIHPNTVRLYEKLELIPKPKRRPNGYRVFTDVHLEQFKLARIALRAEVLQNGLRKKAIDIIKTSAAGNYEKAIALAENYMKQISIEQKNAEEAIEIAIELLSEHQKEKSGLCLTRKETADHLQITTDTLRNWEMNGLLSVKRKQNGYRIYTETDIQRLKIIRSLRCANYSLASILRMLNALSFNPAINLREIINTPQARDHTDHVVYACDKLITSLQNLKQDAYEIVDRLKNMKERFKNTSSF